MDFLLHPLLSSRSPGTKKTRGRTQRRPRAQLTPANSLLAGHSLLSPLLGHKKAAHATQYRNPCLSLRSWPRQASPPWLRIGRTSQISSLHIIVLVKSTHNFCQAKSSLFSVFFLAEHHVAAA